MSNIKWTKEQQQVIQSRSSNLLVSAAAGSGKTAVLIERIIQLILDENNPIDIDELLVVTFTKAAASEMRERVGREIEKALGLNPENTHLQRQLMLLNSADIATIDSFCNKVLKTHSHIVNLDSNFKVVEPSENDILALETVEELFEDLYEENNENFLNLLSWYSSKRGDSKLSELILTINNFINSYPFPIKWLKDKVEFLNDNKDKDFYLKNYISEILEDIVINFQSFSLDIENNLKAIEGIQELEKYVEINNLYLESFYKLKNEVVKVFDNLTVENYDKLHESINDFLIEKFQTFRISSKCDSNIKDLYKTVKEELDSIKSDIRESLELLNINIEDIIKENRMIYPYMNALSNVVILFREKFSQKKREMNLVDFSDIEHCTLDILVNLDETGELIPTDIALSYRKKYKEVFVDEYQDSNLVQEIILSTVSNWDKPNRFMVGDVKQSIYRFRQADPTIFMEKYNSFDFVEDKPNSLNRKILLYSNFRSRAEILEGTNHIFSNIMRKRTGELDYTDKERLNPTAEFSINTEENIGGAIEILLVQNDKKENKDLVTDYRTVDLEEYNEIKSFRLEAIKIANIINETVKEKKGNFKVFDKELGAYRDVTYKDIVILMRSPSMNGKILEEVFADYEIPIYSESSGGYYETFEVDTIINLPSIRDFP